MSNIVEIRSMSFAREGRPIFKNVNIDIPRGQVVAIMGPSGTGKTTLLRLIGGQLRPCAGQVIFDGQEVGAQSRQQLFQMRQKMGMLFQSGALFTHYNVFDNVAFPLRELTSFTEDFIEKIVLMKLQAVGLRGAVDLMPAQLSGGMSRRVALARSIVLDPALIKYDEPFTGLDPIAKGVIVRLIRRLNDALGMTSVVVSHDVHETAEIADYVYILADGEIIGQGKPDILFEDPNPLVKQFMQGLSDGVVPFHYPANDYVEALGVSS